MIGEVGLTELTETDEQLAQLYELMHSIRKAEAENEDEPNIAGQKAS